MVFQHHPDNLVYVRGEEHTYVDTPANFALDLGKPYEFAGRERIYEPNIKHFIDGQPQDLTWPEGDEYLSKIDNLLEAQAKRLSPPKPTVGQTKVIAVAEINRLAGEARSRVGTNIPFQGDVYQLKGEEAFAFASDPEPSQYKYPLLYAEAQARGMELSALVAEYAYNAVMWPRILAAIEAVRMGARVALAAAESVEEIAEILAAVVWPV